MPRRVGSRLENAAERISERVSRISSISLVPVAWQAVRDSTHCSLISPRDFFWCGVSKDVNKRRNQPPTKRRKNNNYEKDPLTRSHGRWSIHLRGQRPCWRCASLTESESLAGLTQNGAGNYARPDRPIREGWLAESFGFGAGTAESTRHDAGHACA